MTWATIMVNHSLNGKNTIQFKPHPLEVLPITYKNEVIERNFFTTFGRLTYKQIQFWLTGKNGEISKQIGFFSGDNVDSWREKYWQDYIEKFHRKNTAWEHEHEYRILLHDTFYQYAQKENRLLQYDPTSLSGVIFGINTSIDDKFKLMQAIKLVGDKFKDVKFFQSEYEEDTQEIIIREKIYPDKKI